MANTFQTSYASAPDFEYTKYGMRKRFVKRTGRYDLLQDGDINLNKNRGADDYISAAIRYLDETCYTYKQSARFVKPIAANAIKCVVPRLLQIKSIRMISADGVCDLTKKGVHFWAFRQAVGPTSTWCTGAPDMWSFVIDELVEDTTKAELEGDGAIDIDEIIDTVSPDNVAIMWYPKLDQAATLDIMGKFYSKPLVLDTDWNYWTKKHPDIVLLAAQYKMEIELANVSRAESYLRALQLELDRLDSASIILEDSTETWEIK